jgi:hypothetical protein
MPWIVDRRLCRLAVNQLTILRLVCAFMTGTTAWVNRNVPERLKSISLCHR